ncbi:MAG: SdiA-regulated domain-containing protein [Sandaracinaceae bacterium]
MAWRERVCVPLEVPQASGLTALDDGTFAVVSDEGGVYRANRDGSAELWVAAPALDDLEGICRDPSGALFVVSERTGDVSRIEDGEVTTCGTLASIGRKRNKGWEGLAYRPARFGGPHFIACHERSPRRLGVFDPVTLSTVAILRLPKATRRALADLSDLTVDPETGHWLVLSDESARIAELRYEDGELAHLDAFRVDVGKREKPEGLTFDADGRLWMATDGDPHLRCFAR